MSTAEAKGKAKVGDAANNKKRKFAATTYRASKRVGIDTDVFSNDIRKLADDINDPTIKAKRAKNKDARKTDKTVEKVRVDYKLSKATVEAIDRLLVDAASEITAAASDLAKHGRERSILRSGDLKLSTMVYFGMGVDGGEGLKKMLDAGRKSLDKHIESVSK